MATMPLDVMRLPEPKRPNFLKASKDQLKVLLAGFEVSDACSKDHLASLHEATGLPPKWIISWFSRQRRKTGKTREKTKRQKDTTNESDAPMSMQEITDFKTEHSDENFPLSTVQEVESNTERKPVLSKTQPKTRKSKKKRDIPPTAYPDSSASSLKAPFISAPLALRSVLSSAGQPFIQADAQVADLDSPTATFHLRETTTQLDQSRGSPLTPNNIDPALSASLGAIRTDIPMPYPSMASSTTVPHPDRLAENAGDNHAKSSIDVPQHKPTTVYSRQEIISEGIKDGKNQNNVRTVFKNVREVENAATTLEPRSLAPSAQENRHSRPGHCLRPLVPVDPQYPLDYYRAYEAHLQRQSDKENERPCLHTRSSGQRNLPPLLTTIDLTKVRQQPPAANILNPIPMAIQPHSLVQSIHQPYQQLQLNDQCQNDDQPIDAFFFDPMTESLKHLNVLAPFPNENLPPDQIIHRLLDERLAVEDPFQAAMGLVFASQLGVSWDFT